MPKKVKTHEEHLQTIEYLLAGLLLKKETDTEKVAKIIGCRKQTLIAMYTEGKKGKKNGKKRK